MSTIILLDDEEPVRKAFEQMFEDLEIGASLLTCSNPEEYEHAAEESKGSLKAIIIDLSNTPQEADSKKYKAAQYISNQFTENRIPIFVHSGNLQHYDAMNDCGTVFKIEKSKSSTEKICSSIRLMEESGFLNIFSFNGSIENQLMSELHSSFISQFKGNEIEEIIQSIKSSSDNPETYQARTSEVFKRIAIRSVYENTVSSGEGTSEVKLNAIEHYYRRTDTRLFWTGDIFINQKKDERIIILTPRCNIENKNYAGLLACSVQTFDQEKINQLTGRKGEANLRKNITDDVSLVGERFRFLPPTPQFTGGIVDFIEIRTIEEETLKKEFELLITVSDELANDVVRKLANYVLRGGISNTEFKEAHYYVTQLEKTDIETEVMKPKIV